jgi:hypothetical protein
LPVCGKRIADPDYGFITLSADTRRNRNVRAHVLFGKNRLRTAGLELADVKMMLRSEQRLCVS